MVVLLILKALYFFLPAYVANMAPVIFQKVSFLDTAISEKWFGKNKTWRGLVLGIIAGVVVFWLQQIAYNQGFQDLAIIDYSDFSLLLGVLLGGGALVGDLVGSFFKRRARIPPGKPWPVFDQLDFVIGGFVFSFLVYVPKAEVALVIFVASPVLHVVVNHIAYWLRIRDVKW